VKQRTQKKLGEPLMLFNSQECFHFPLMMTTPVHPPDEDAVP
jgi:hypothetical protein